MAYDDENISDKLKKRAGTDLSTLTDENLDRLYSETMDGYDRKGQEMSRGDIDQYIEDHGRGRYNSMRNEIDYAKYSGGSTDQYEDYMKEGNAGWNDIRQAVGISNVDSRSDLQQMYKAVGDEYMKRMVGDGVDGLAKAEDIAQPATEAQPKPKPVPSKKLKDANEAVSSFESDFLSQGDMISGKAPAASTETSTSSGRDKDYLDSYKLNLANQMSPTDGSGNARSSKVQDFKNKQKQKGLI